MQRRTFLAVLPATLALLTATVPTAQGATADFTSQDKVKSAVAPWAVGTVAGSRARAVPYTHLTLPTELGVCDSRGHVSLGAHARRRQ
ncbi:hypothetical protein, partial [Streptomyces albidoflavus]|uniref:hypothetical protein n=1 Tax=Streptomyces albidoflavus TaxID=1886 RepID=UPI000BDD3C89